MPPPPSKNFRKNSECKFFQKTPNTVLLITQQPNIAQRPFCIQNQRQILVWGWGFATKTEWILEISVNLKLTAGNRMQGV